MRRAVLISSRDDTRSFEPDAADVALFVETSLEFHRYGLRSFPFLKPGGVVLLNCEDDAADTIAPRLDKAGADDARIVLLEGVKHFDRRRQFSLESDLPRLEVVLKEYDETRLRELFRCKVSDINSIEVSRMDRTVLFDYPTLERWCPLLEADRFV